MTTQFDRALSEITKSGIRNEAHRRVEWRRFLREELDDEKRRVNVLDLCTNHIIVFWEQVIKYRDMQNSLTSRNNGITFLFDAMHRVAYVDDLLGSTGILKEATETRP